MTGLGIHAVVYAAVNLLLLFIWVMLGGSADQIGTYLTNWNAARDAHFWPLYVMVLWGVGLVIHAGVTVVTYPKRMRAKRARRRQRESIQRTVLGILDGTMLEGAAIAAIRATDGEQAAKRVQKQVRVARGEREDRHRPPRVPVPPGVPSGRPPRDRDRRPSSPSGSRSRDRRRANDRQWVAVMFTDIVESTRLNHQLGDEEWAKVLGDHRSAVRECIAKHEGAEVGTQGDGFLLRFSSPDKAVACATALQRGWSTARVASATTEGAKPVPAVRIGIHAGEVMHDEDDLVGKVINLASRVTDVADADEILVTEPLADHLTDDVKLVDRGLKTLKGFDRPRHLLAIVWQDSPAVVVLDEPDEEPSELT